VTTIVSVQKNMVVELIAPTMGSVGEDKLSLADFQLSDEGEVVACPQGNAPAKIKKGKK
jgi:hypothetical protein